MRIRLRETVSVGRRRTNLKIRKISVITVVITQHEKTDISNIGHMQSVWVHHFVIGPAVRINIFSTS